MMNSHINPLRHAVAALLLCLAVPAQALAPKSNGAPQTPAAGPAPFIVNAGQWPVSTRFASRRGTLDVSLEADGIRMRRTGAKAELAVRFGANATLRGEGERRARYHFFTGSDRSQWRTNVRSFDRVRYVGVAPGADVVVHQGPTGVQYDIELAVGAHARGIAFDCEGADRLALADDGALVVTVGKEHIRHTAPVAWQVRSDGSTTPIACGFRIIDGHSYGFWTEDLDPGLATVIDPQVDYATYLGGSGVDSGKSVAIDAQGFVYVTGNTESTDWVPAPQVHGTYHGASTAVFVAKLDPRAAPGESLVFLTVIGGSDWVTARSMTLGPNDATVHLTGVTRSVDFPILTPTIGLRTNKGGHEAFATCLDSATGSVLVYSVLIGGQGNDAGTDIAVSSAGNTTVVGRKEDDGIPTLAGDPNTVLHGPRGEVDVFLVVLDPIGARLGTALIGGASGDSPWAITHDATGNIYVVGSTGNDQSKPASWFPRVLAGSKLPMAQTGGKTKGRKVTVNPNDGDAFVMRLGPGLDLQFSTLLGGSNRDSGQGVVMDGLRLHIAGRTQSADFSTVAPIVDESLGLDGATLSGGQDLFVATFDFSDFVLAATGPDLVFATYFGGDTIEHLNDGPKLGLDSVGNLYVAGSIFGQKPKGKKGNDWTPFPSRGTQLKTPTVEGNGDAFLVIFAPAGTGRTVAYSTLIGGSNSELSVSLAVGPDDCVAIVFQTYSAGLFTSANAVLGAIPGSTSTGYLRVIESPVGL